VAITQLVFGIVQIVMKIYVWSRRRYDRIGEAKRDKLRGETKSLNEKKEKSMKKEIGETAGRIWEILKKKGEVSTSQLPRILNKKSVVAYQGLGWLAREDKVEYQVKAGKTYVSLTESERGL
jgi:predicted HTH transcriptional regulator